ncbi:MAG: YybS family protein [Gemmatimonadota bacterium]|nr:YybS family protein [Gemmatimonadota bacterium]MDH3422553.1 YybS family protein [Gemmatimonadota bacterium]
MEQVINGGARGTQRGWPRVAGLFGVVLATSVFVQPTVLIGVPLVFLLAARGFGNVAAAGVAGLLIVIISGGLGGFSDGLWYAERAWAVLLGGWFLTLTLLLPGWRLTSRALAASAAAAVVAGAIMVLREGGWSTLDAAISLSVQAETDATLSAISLIGGSDVLSPDVVTLMRDIATTRVMVFPALLGIESLAALAVAWWVRSRLVGEGDQGLAPLRDFRFNDHLVWVLVAGILLLVLQSGEAFARVGSNAVVFMGALYALRGLAVYFFVSGGLSVIGYAVFAVLLVLVPPVILGTAALIGIGDTWLDLRARSAQKAI